MTHRKPKGKRVAIQWEEKPRHLTPAEIEALSEMDGNAYWAHLSVHAADRSARYALYGALTLATAVVLLLSTVVLTLWILS